MTREERIAGVPFDPAAVEREHVRACNLCGSTALVEAARRDRYGYPTVFVVCARCGLGFLSPRPTADAYAGFYARTYRPLVSAYHGRRIDAETVQVEQRGYAEELRTHLGRLTGAQPASVLDVGGSTGVVAAAFATPETRVTVLDPAADELAVARAAGMEAIEGFAEDFDPGARRWDLVLLCQTIDHLLDIGATLEALHRLVADDGHVFVDVLDVSWVLERQGAIERAVKIDHPYYLTRATALGFFARTGLDVVGERLSDDGHWGFTLRRGTPREPDWTTLQATADALLDRIWSARAGAR